MEARFTMGMKGAPMTDATFDYIVERFAVPERDLVRKMAKRAEAAGMPMIMISEEQAKFLRVLLKAAGAKRVLDIGTLFGFSAAVMAYALPPEGRVTSLESEEKHAMVARANLKEAGLDAKVEVLVGPALASMQRMPPDSFDFVLIDADKEGYVAYLEESVRLVRDGGVIAGDNALAWGLVSENNLSPKSPRTPNVKAIQKFNDALAGRKDLDSVILPVGDGLSLSVVSKGRRRAKA